MWGKAPFKAPNNYGPVEDWAFSMYIMDIEKEKEDEERNCDYDEISDEENDQ